MWAILRVNTETSPFLYSFQSAINLFSFSLFFVQFPLIWNEFFSFIQNYVVHKAAAKQYHYSINESIVIRKTIHNSFSRMLIVRIWLTLNFVFIIFFLTFATNQLKWMRKFCAAILIFFSGFCTITCFAILTEMSWA